MKTIGLIGGMSWESSMEYYRIINEAVKRKLGGLHSSKCILFSVDFAEIEELQTGGKWSEAAEHMIRAARSLERAGADFFVICTNTMHKLAEDVRSGVNIPLLHIADAAAGAIRAANFRTVGLLGTRYTMEEDFYRRRLEEKHGLKILVPETEDRARVNEIIFRELCLGSVKPESREYYLDVIGKLSRAGAEGVILGCTEIELLVRPEDSQIPLFPTTRLHAEAAAEYALNGAPDLVG